MKEIKEEFTIGINLTGFPKLLGCGVMVDGEHITSREQLTDEQLAAASLALDSLRFDMQVEFHKRVNGLPSYGMFADDPRGDA